MAEHLITRWYHRTAASRPAAAAATLLAVALFLFAGAEVVHAAVDAESQFVFNTFAFLVWGRW